MHQDDKFVEIKEFSKKLNSVENLTMEHKLNDGHIVVIICSISTYDDITYLNITLHHYTGKEEKYETYLFSWYEWGGMENTTKDGHELTDEEFTELINILKVIKIRG